MRICLPKSVEIIINEIKKSGHEAYAVGGCVRDAVMGREPNDWDITTSAKPSMIKDIFNATIDTGIKHGTVTVLIKSEPYEVTTYRIDGEYTDGRHPDEVLFTRDLSEDLRRRDFTINAMAYNYEEGIVDLFGGKQDIENGIIRCVGKAEERFTEDALRMLRALRFSAQLGFEIEKETLEAICKMVANMEKISRERIQVELIKLLISSNPGKALYLRETGMIDVIIKEMSKTNMDDAAWQRVIQRLDYDLKHGAAAEVGDEQMKVNIKNVRLACFMSEVRDEAKDILKGLKLDNKTMNAVATLLKYVDDEIFGDEVSVRRSICRVGKDIYADYIAFRAAYFGQKEDKLSAIFRKIIEEGHCISIKELAITGSDLAEIGIERNAKMGIIINELLERVIVDQSLNDKDKLITLAKELV